MENYILVIDLLTCSVIFAIIIWPTDTAVEFFFFFSFAWIKHGFI